MWHRDDKDVFLPQHIYKNKFWDFFLCPMYAKNIIQFFHLKHKCNLNKEKIEISNNENFFHITSMSMSNVPKSWICFEKMTLAALLDQSSNFTLFQKKMSSFFLQIRLYSIIKYSITLFFFSFSWYYMGWRTYWAKCGHKYGLQDSLCRFGFTTGNHRLA